MTQGDDRRYLMRIRVACCVLCLAATLTSWQVPGYGGTARAVATRIRLASTAAPFACTGSRDLIIDRGYVTIAPGVYRYDRLCVQDKGVLTSYGALTLRVGALYVAADSAISTDGPNGLSSSSSRFLGPRYSACCRSTSACAVAPLRLACARPQLGPASATVGYRASAPAPVAPVLPGTTPTRRSTAAPASGSRSPKRPSAPRYPRSVEALP